MDPNSYDMELLFRVYRGDDFRTWGYQDFVTAKRLRQDGLLVIDHSSSIPGRSGFLPTHDLTDRGRALVEALFRDD